MSRRKKVMDHGSGLPTSLSVKTKTNVLESYGKEKK